MFLRRDARSGAGLLEWRIRLFGAGAILGMAGIFAEAAWMIWIAIAVLVAGFLLRFAERTDPLSDDAEDAEDDQG